MQQGQYAQYPQPPTREIDFGVISEAFQLLFKNIGPFLVAAFLGYLIPVAISYAVTIGLEFSLGMINTDPTATPDVAGMMAKLPIVYGVQILMVFVQYVIQGPFAYSIVHMTFMLNRGEKPAISDAFVGFSHFGSAIGASILPMLLTIIGMVFCIVPGFLVGGLLMFTMPLVVERKMGVMDAMRGSYELLIKNIWMAALFWFVYAIVSGLGFLCCIGILVTWPILYIVPTLTYRDFTMGRGMPVQVSTYEESNPYPPTGYAAPSEVPQVHEEPTPQVAPEVPSVPDEPEGPQVTEVHDESYEDPTAEQTDPE